MSRQEAVPIGACRVCNSHELRMMLSLGLQFIPDFVTSEGHNPKAPLELVRCRDCGLVQLRHTTPRANLYRHYWYKSGISPTMRNALAEITSAACEIGGVSPGDLVLDIGCNDGTLLRSYPPGLRLVGFEPAENLVPEARKGTSWIFNDFFTSRAFEEKFGSQKARIVTSIAMFYDLDNPNDFVRDVAAVLAPDGVWVVQQNYLVTMLEKNGFDNIGHEHLEYYSLATMGNLLERHGLEIFEAETNDVNGGSFRTFICHRGRYKRREGVDRLRKKEDSMQLNGDEVYQRFAMNIRNIKAKVHEFVVDEVKSGKSVYVYGASNRGNTILQYCELDHDLIKKAADANPEKWGRKIAGTHIPIISKEEARKDNPDYFLVLPHHFLKEITREERPYLKAGGKLIVPLPEFRLVIDDEVSQ